MITRRAAASGLVGLAASTPFMRGARAAAPAWNVPPEGVGQRIKHISWSDQGGRPDGVQIMLNRHHLYIGHQFTDGFSVMDTSDPRNLKPVKYVLTGPNTSTHHLQVANDILLVAEGANVMAMQSYDDARSYFENTLADSITKKVPFRAGLSVWDIKTDPASPRQIAFLQLPGFGINRLWWTGGRYAYVAAHLDGFTDHILGIVDVSNITKPQLVSKAWLPGMNRAAKEPNTTPKGKRVALHHMIVAGNRGYGAWRDGGFTIHDISDAAHPKLLSHINWTPPFAGGTHTPLPLPGRKLVLVAEESNAENCEKGMFFTWVVDVRNDANPLPIGSLPAPKDRNYCAIGNFGPHNLHENRPGSFQSETTIFATYHNAGVRVFDIKNQFEPKEIAYWVPPAPSKLVDTHSG
ncbi:MAG TPA: hypothetical protein VHT51_01285, partial [Micropepsaceae bacterium]|nr:hypothetical protein [Micropepsaceae bacterium]